MHSDNKNSGHQRRVRYKGTHPTTFKDRYKEQKPELYAETVAKVIQKGSTPAGMHISICVGEILGLLKIQSGETGLDATLGYGGHSLEMLKQLNGKGHLYVLDVDPIELPRTQERLNRMGFGAEIFSPRHLNFSNIDEVIPESGLLNFVLADLGVSSMQIDNPERGFSYKTDGPLDLRLNPHMGVSAANRLQKMRFDALRAMLEENADEPHAEVIAKAITANIKQGIKVATTTDLRNIIKDALKTVPGTCAEDVKKSCQRCFQALRIDVNQEFDVLDTFLEKLPDVLASGGRVAILTFHSGEDRRVKKSFKRLFLQGVYSEIAPDPIRPTAEECRINPRARSAKLRWAIKR